MKLKEEQNKGIKGLFGKIKSTVLKEEVKEAEEAKQGQTMRITKTLAQNIVFNSSSSFISIFIGLRLTFVQAKELMLYFCKKYELD